MIFVLLFTYSLLGFIVLPYLIQSNFNKIVKENLGANGYLSRVYINPFTFKIELHKLLIQDDKYKTLLYFKSLETDFELLALIFKEIKLDYLYIDSFKTSFTLYENNKFNFNHILNHLNQTKDEKATVNSENDVSSLIFTVDDLFLKNTRITFNDNTKSKPFQIKTKPFDFEMEDFSTEENSVAIINTKINVINTLNLDLSSEFTLIPMKLEGNASVNKLQLAKIYDYLEEDLKFKFDGIIQNISSSFNINVKDEITQAKIKDFNISIPNAKYLDKQYKIELQDLTHTVKSINISHDKVLNFDLNNISLKNQKIYFTDLITNKNNILMFDNLDINLDTISSDKSKISNITLSLKTPKSGDINLALDLMQEPLNIKGNVNLEQTDIVPYQDYIKNFINLDIKKTFVDIDSSFNIDGPKQDIQANIKISDVDLFHELTQKRLLQVNTFDIKGLNYTNNNLFIENVKIDTFNTTFKIDKNKHTNIDDLIVTEEKNEDKIAKTKNETTKSNFHYYIKDLIISNGKADFSDYSLPLNFDTKIHNLNATVNDLSSKNKVADINLKGVIDKYGLANINATSMLSDFKNKTKVLVKFENLDVTSFSPYSGKFIGQKISDGRLSLDLNYNIKNAQLSSTNNIKIKNLTLGDDVKSKDALSLPIGLAIALLEDSDGLIELDVPVTGDMESPSFELSGVIWKTLGNVITNIVTAPFRFLGSLLGMDSDELGIIEFNFAQADILPPQKEKLDKLIGVLQKKNKLHILIEPTFHLIHDKKKLQKIKFLQLIKSENKDEMIRKIYIERFGKDKMEVLLSETKEEQQIEKLSQEIIDSIAITKEDLNQLAIKRANSINNYFLSNKLTLDRIQIKENIFENKDKNTQILPLKLELNIKEEK